MPSSSNRTNTVRRSSGIVARTRSAEQLFRYALDDGTRVYEPQTVESVDLPITGANEVRIIVSMMVAQAL